MNRFFGLNQLLLAGAAAGSALLLSTQARAGFSPEQLAGFEVTHVRGVVSTVLPAEKVIEVIDPEGHKEIVTVGIDMTPLGLKPGDGVDVSVLDGLVVDLERSAGNQLSFDREDIIMPSDMGPLRKGMRVALASGTARVIKLSDKDRSLSLMGPLGGIHNLDVIAPSGTDLFPSLKVGDLVTFRMIQPVAVDIDKVSTAAAPSRSVQPPLVAAVVNNSASLKAELLRYFEVTQVKGTLQRVMPAERVMELRSPYGHNMLITIGGGLQAQGLQPGDTVVVDILDGLVVDLRQSATKKLTFRREDVILSEDFGDVRKGARVAMATGTAEVVKVSEADQEISLRGPFGGVHNLDVRDGINGDPMPALKVGDFVEFRAINPIAIAIRLAS
ncbi:MAG: hypothetical protein ISQ52_00730 [Synechococcus sp. BS307-5m-G38]|nr:hypothetical protein [Synechococcus sp. BS307-5m-G38]